MVQVLVVSLFPLLMWHGCKSTNSNSRPRTDEEKTAIKELVQSLERRARAVDAELSQALVLSRNVVAGSSKCQVDLPTLADVASDDAAYRAIALRTTFLADGAAPTASHAELVNTQRELLATQWEGQLNQPIAGTADPLRERLQTIRVGARYGFWAIADSRGPELLANKKFSSGQSFGHFYVYDRDAGRIVCVADVQAESSEIVAIGRFYQWESPSEQERQEALDADLKLNIVGNALEALHEATTR